MAVLGNYENGPLSPMGWATGPLWPPVAQAMGDRDLFVIFFQFFSSNRSLAGDAVQGGRSPPPTDDRGPVAPHRATGQGCPI